MFKLDTSSVKDVYYSADEYSQTNLEELESNIKEDRTDLDLLFGCLLDWGLPRRAVFRDSSFASSPEKINVFEIFKLYAPDTDVKVI